MSYVLWLVSWYPNRTDPFAGDFIERHAMAVSKYEKVVVVFVTRDNEKESATEVSNSGNLVIYRGYYKVGTGIFEKLSSFNTYRRLQKKIISEVIKKMGPPSLVHVHVAMKAGLGALFLKRSRGIRYIVTEHWTGYFKTAVKNIYNSVPLFKRLNIKILKEAELILPVSRDLGETIKKLSNKDYSIVPNVVDTAVFNYDPAASEPFRFIHVSTMSRQKNPLSIINAAKMLQEEGYTFNVVMIGSSDPRSLMKDAGPVIIKGIIPYTEVAAEMKRSNAFVLFSRVENMPCVILEALCCGLPVISNIVGGVSEVIDGSNGIIIDENTEVSLKDAMKKMIDGYEKYNRMEISKQAASAYNYETVARMIIDIYNRYR